jgi:predicted TIM-barrel fold metal-dependent hydrolase
VAELTKRGLSLDTWQYFFQLPALASLACHCPDARIMIDHVGGVVGIGAYAGRMTEIFETWRSYIRDLAQYPNLWLKLGGLGMDITGFDFPERTPPAGSEEIAAAWRPYIETCIEAFGPERCMFESNFPIDRPSCSYRTLWNAFKRIASGASVDEKRLLFRDNAVEFYRL